MKEAIATVSQHSPSSDPLADFGANEWLVDEMYDQYLKDKSSVDASWQTYFAAHPNGANGSGTEHGGREPARQAGRRQPRHPCSRPSRPRAPRRRTPAPAPAAAKPAPAPAAAKPASQPRPATAPAPARSDESESATLRGPAARVVANMETSLTVPTATSVRAVPAKLLIDNRVVVNNHLARSRGGKVSFTHLIGYAAVKAVTALPEMNRGFAEIDGKPSVVTPAHVNLGLAIDVVQAGRLALSARARTSSGPRRWTSPSSGRRTRTSSAARARTS